MEALPSAQALDSPRMQRLALGACQVVQGELNQLDSLDVKKQLYFANWAEKITTVLANVEIDKNIDNEVIYNGTK